MKYPEVVPVVSPTLTPKNSAKPCTGYVEFGKDLQAAVRWLSYALLTEGAQPEITPRIAQIAAERIVIGRSLATRRNLPPETIRSALRIVFEVSAVLDQATLTKGEAELLHAKAV